jgi:hypothetical protein
MSMALFHHAGLAMASYAHDYCYQLLRFIPSKMISTPEYISTHVTSIGSHDGQVILVNDLLHLLHAAEVAQHVAHRDNVAVLDELGSDGLAAFDGAGTDGLYSQFCATMT